MTRLWSPASVKSVWSFCVSPALMPTRGWSSPRITTSVSRRSYHVRRLTIKTLFWLHSYCVAVTWTCRCFKLSSINLKYKVILGLIIRWSLDEMFVICMSYILLICFCRNTEDFYTKTSVLWSPQARAPEIVLWDMWSSHMQRLPTAKAQRPQVHSRFYLVINTLAVFCNQL